MGDPMTGVGVGILAIGLYYLVPLVLRRIAGSGVSQDKETGGEDER